MSELILDTSYSEIEYDIAMKVMQEFTSGQTEEAKFEFSEASNLDFDDQLQASRIRKPKFDHCRFTGVNFLGNNAVGSRIVDCTFFSGKFKDVCFNYSNLSSTNFCSTIFDNCGCSHCDFSGATFSQVAMSGCDFLESHFSHTLFDHIIVGHCSVEEADFKDVRMLDSDLTELTCDYARFENVEFTNVTLPFWGILKSFGGLDAIARHPEQISIKYSSTAPAIKAESFLAKLNDLRPYFFKEKQYFVLANICIYAGEQSLALQYILEGLKCGIQARDFRAVRHLCELASRNCFFSTKQLQQLYQAITANDATLDMSTYEYQCYLSEIRTLKYILVDNPYELPQMTISLSTSLPCHDYNALGEMLRFVDNSIKYYIPQSVYHIAIRRNSPPHIDIIISDALPVLVSFLVFSASLILGATNKGVQMLSDLFKMHGYHLDNKEKKTRLALAKQQEELKIEQLELENESLRLKIEKQKQDLTQMQQTAREGKTPLSQDDSEPNLRSDLREAVKSIHFSIQSSTPDSLPLKAGDLLAER